jgi:hypothetical protein
MEEGRFWNKRFGHDDDHLIRSYEHESHHKQSLLGDEAEEQSIECLKTLSIKPCREAMHESVSIYS